MSKEIDSHEENKIVLEKKLNSVYYNHENGSLNQEAARNSYAELFAYHRYSLREAVLGNKPEVSTCGDSLWILDFGLGDFTNVGLGGVFFVKDLLRQYYVLELYLLPFQLIPEHYHTVETVDVPEKAEYRQVRYGDIWFFPQGGNEPNLVDTPPDVAEAIQGQLTAKAIHGYKGNRVNTGEIYTEQTLNEPHWIIAGKQGAILSVYSNFNILENPVFSNQAIKLV